MSITGKARKAKMAILQQQQDSPSSTLAVVNPTIRRVRSIVTVLSNFVLDSGTEHQRRMQRILDIIIDESMDELAEMDELSLSAWMHNMACAIEWTATGDLSVLPPELIPFACQIDGIDYAQMMADAEKRGEEIRAEMIADAEQARADDIVEAELLPVDPGT